MNNAPTLHPSSPGGFPVLRPQRLWRAALGTLGALGALALALSAHAADITVTNTNDSGPGSLRQAIIDVPANGSIAFAIPTTDPGYNATTGMSTITLSSQIVPGNGFTLTGPGQNRLTISGNHAHRMFETTQANTYVFSGVTFANGIETDYYGYGGAFLGRGATLTFSNCAFTGNTDGSAGGVISGGGALTFTNCLFQDNACSGAGGAIYVESGTTTVSSCTFLRNTGFGSGTIYNGGGTVTLTNSTVSGDTDGSAVVNGSGSMSIVSYTISGNSAPSYYGAGVCNYATLAISNSAITGNSTPYLGGGICNFGTLTLSNSTIAGNSAAGGGGIYGGNGCPLTITNCTITQNSAAGVAGNVNSGGGGLNARSRGSTSASISNTIIAGNADALFPDYFGYVNSQGYNLVGNNTGAMASNGYANFGATGDLVGTSAAPLDPKLGPLQNNGGPTFTCLPLPGSPAIDAGDPAFNVNSLYYDQRGYQRVSNGRLDIGAVESSSYLNLPPTAVPGPNGPTHPGKLVSLNGSASFDDNTPSASLGYAWSFFSKPAGSTAMLKNATTATPSFTPDLIGDYVVQLIVTDTGFPALSSAPVTVTYSSYNQAPTGAASVSNALPLIGQPVTLSSAGSVDPEGDAITYAWSITSAPAGSKAKIANATAATASLTPDVAGTYVVKVTPSDFLGAGTPATASFNASTKAGYIHDQLAAAIATVQALPASAVTSKGNQLEFIALLQLANAGSQQQCSLGYLLAIVQIDLALNRTDGIPLRGKVDTGLLNRDWILDANAQRSVYTALTNARAMLVTLTGCP